MDASFAIASNVVKTAFDDLPAKAIAVTKVGILDTLGCMLGASAAGEGVREMVELAREAGGKKESSVLAFGGKLPCAMAAFANGAMGHPLDYDDTHDEAGVHPTTATLPAALAVAERCVKTGGREFITALALGNDAVCRLGLAAKSNPGWLLPQLFGVFGATIASGKLLGLTEEQMLNALGLAYHQTSGNMEVSYQTGSIIRAIRDGFTAKTGVMSALMAQKGLTGPKAVFESKAGLFDLYFRGDYDPTPLTAGLGNNFEGVNVSFKPWPARRTTHPYVEATLAIMRENSIRTERIRRITAVGEIQSLCEPLEQRRKPAKAIDAKLSLPYILGVAALRGTVVIADFTAEALKDRAAQDMAAKVDYRGGNGPDRMGTGDVELTTVDGMTYSRHVEYSYGHPKNPISREDLVAKFRDCAAYSANSLSPETVEQIIHLTDRLETLKDMRRLIRLVS